MRRAIWVTALAALAAACSGEAAPTPALTPGATIQPVGVPADAPPSYERDVGASEVPPDALVPPGTSVTDVWYAEASAGSSILVAYVEAGADPFRQEHGIIVWRRLPGEPDPWRPVFGLRDPPGRGVVQIRAIIGDATGDGSPDALTFEETGGSGACGTWRVLDLAGNAAVFEKKTCDTTIDLSTDAVGIVIREAVFSDGDAHCCPSATRTSVLTYAGEGAWSIASRELEPSSVGA
jgi:hypothetical protein